MIGAQTPRLQVEPKRAYTDGTLAAMLMEAYGLPMYDWQRLVVDCWLALSKSTICQSLSCCQYAMFRTAGARPVSDLPRSE